MQEPSARWPFFLFYFLFVITALTACSNNTEMTAEPVQLRIAVIPDESPAKIRARLLPLIAHLEAQTGLEVSLRIPANYAELLTWFHEGQVDLVRFGGVTFARAHLDDGALPLVMRDVDMRFSSYFIVKSDHEAQSIADLKGQSFSFGSRLSTSGHMYPRLFLTQQGIEAEQFFAKVSYSGAHDKTALLVQDGVVAAGVANAVIINEMYADGRLDKNKVRILWETPPYPDYVWAVQHELPQAVREHILDAFLVLNTMDDAHQRILALLHAGSYQPSDLSMYQELIELVNQMQLDIPQS